MVRSWHRTKCKVIAINVASESTIKLASITDTTSKIELSSFESSIETASITSTTYYQALAFQKLTIKLMHYQIINNFNSIQKKSSFGDREEKINEIFDEILNCVGKMKKLPRTTTTKKQYKFDSTLSSANNTEKESDNINSTQKNHLLKQHQLPVRHIIRLWHSRNREEKINEIFDEILNCVGKMKKLPRTTTTKKQYKC
ncbi:hypothetical protein Glove_19g214 [Diversispora epigaea]|uniref:DUF1835 domain-containing protein n=1 Tax=Diversispora epigaea TaxID=1348612 RepID=A0A397JSG5_9GLOM|nr:hypothetical protein Glove_19g214 [Diversispora epigaea]